MSARSVLCVLLLSTCSVEIVTQSMFAEGYPARRNAAKGRGNIYACSNYFAVYGKPYAY